jgi:hypothetical protein
MPLRWTTTDRAGTSHGVKCLVYSASGVGKTRLCATAPRPLIISAESGLLSLRKVSIPTIEVSTMAELQEAYRWVTTAAESAQFETVCLDSLTEMAEVLLANLIKTKGQNDPRKAFGELIPQMSEMIRAFRDIPGKNVYMSAKMEYTKDEETGRMIYTISMPGQKLGPQIPFFFDEVFFLGISKPDAQGNTFRYLQTQPDIQHVAKDRSDSLAMYEPPDLGALFRKMLTK